MAILAPSQMPAVLKVPSDPLKLYALAQLGHPQVSVELSENQWETALRVTGDFIAGYFPREQRMGLFWTNPLVPTYPMPPDAYWVQEVNWNPLTTSIHDIFGAEAYLLGAALTGVLGGSNMMMLDLHLLSAYRRTMGKILATEGHWEVLGEGHGGPGTQRIRLYPTPKGVFPVVVLYTPIVTHFRSPQARYIASEMLVAEAKCMLGAARRKISGIPGPDGGTISLDGADLVNEGNARKEKLVKDAIDLGEPMQVIMLSILCLITYVAGSLMLMA